MRLGHHTQQSERSERDNSNIDGTLFLAGADDCQGKNTAHPDLP